MLEINKVLVSLLACTFASQTPLQAQHTQPDGEAAAPKFEAGDRYDFTFTAGGWVPRALGEVGLGFDTDAFDLTLEESFDLDNSEGIFNAEIALIKNDGWQIELSGFDFSTETSASFAQFARFGDLVLNPGDAYRSSFDVTSAAVEVGYWLFDVCRMGMSADGTRECRVDFRFAPYVGMRYLDIDHHIEVIGEGSEDAGGEWVGVLGGMNLQMRYRVPDSFPLIEIVEINGSLAAGPAIGGDGGAAAHIRAGITAFFNDHFGLTFGYRLVHFVVENDEYELNGGLQGLFFGGTFRF
jgi:hypothetical protein